MTGNDILRRIRFALDLENSEMLSIFEMAGKTIGIGEMLCYLKKEDEDGYILCGPGIVGAFLDGLIIRNRGPRPDGPAKAAPQPAGALSNNQVLKKLRIALEFQEEDMLRIFEQGELAVSKSELSALFRKEDHRNYKACGDQLLKKFLNGLTVEYRQKKEK